MIVTFHLAVYFAYHVWENYISTLFRTAEDDLNNDVNPRDNNNTSTILFPMPEIVNESRRNSEDTNNSVGPNVDLDTRNVAQGTCNKTNKHNSVEELPRSIQTALKNENEGKRIIYDVEPIYSCNTGIDLDSKELVNGFKFVPPVYTQRYMKVQHILNEPYWISTIKKVIDFGCAELTFEKRYLKKLHSIHELVAVDIDKFLLEFYSSQLQPTPTDYLDQRPTPLTARVFKGSIAHTNEVLLGADAVIGIELIEHLFPPELDDLPYTVFGFIKPKLVVFTTPNADFNVLFPNFSGFRHHDHKFEWSRQQFEDWGNNLVERYPDYRVEYQGIGPGPAHSQHLGCCSQMAVFIRTSDPPPSMEHVLDVQAGEYELINEYVYPYFEDKRTRAEKIKDDAEKFIYACVSLSRQYEEERAKEVPLKSIMERINYYSMAKLKNILSSSWEIKTNKKGYEVVVIPDSDEEDEDDIENADAYSYTEDTEHIEHTNVDNCNNPPAHDEDEDWDLDKTDSQAHVNSTIVSSSSADCVCFPHESVLTDSCSSFLDPHHDKTIVSNTSTDCVCFPHDTDSCPNVLSSSVSLNTDAHEVKVTKPVSESFVFSPVTNSQSELNVPDVSVVIRDQSKVNMDSTLDSEKNCSVYETPYCDFRMKKSDCELYNPSTKSLYHSYLDSNSECSRALSFESPETCRGPEFADRTLNDHSLKALCCDSKVSSFLDTSRYATPCYQPEKKFIPKCLSLQQINAHYSSPILTTDMGSSLSKLDMADEQNILSKSMEGFSCEMHETCSNASKVVDSGYPDSYSDQYMDMDLTPEQIEDIETESEANDVSSRSGSPPLPILAAPARVIDDVQNGDVVNNNRDGEGNNVEADMEEDELEFEAQIEEVNEFLNFAAVDRPVQEIKGEECCNNKSPETDPESVPIKESGIAYESETNGCILELHKIPKHSAGPKHDLHETQEIKTAINSVKSSQSCSSIMTSNGSHSKPDCLSKHDSISDNNIQESCTLKKHNSLTTVFDGCSPFSNSSIDQTLDDKFKSRLIKSQFPAKSIEGKINSFDNIEDCNTSQFSSTHSQQDNASLFSVYQSAGSVSSEVTDSDAESTSFPEWLVSINVSDNNIDEVNINEVNSDLSLWDFDSMAVLVDPDQPSYNLEIDVRAGGDLV